MDPTTAYSAPVIHAETAALGNVAARSGQVPAELAALAHANDRLTSLVDEAFGRLSGVLRSVPEGEVLATALDEVVPVAELLRLERLRVESQSDRLSSLLSRLEL